jgi:hypothetical protein
MEFKHLIEETMGKKWVKPAMVIIMLIVAYIFFALVFSFWPFLIIQKVANANAIIQNYEWFYDQYNNIEAQKANIQIMNINAEELPGMKMVLNKSIAEYNSKSKQITRNLWKADDLPYQITIEGVKE